MSGLPRFFLGFVIGVVLTAYAFTFVGVGHGTFAPMVFAASLIALIPVAGAIPALLLTPFLWAFYFLRITRIQKRSTRVITTVVILASHVLSGAWLANDDHAFTRALDQEPGNLAIFGLILAIAMACLLYFAARGVKPGKS